MEIENILQRKFNEIEVLKGFLCAYPIEYRNNVVDKIVDISEDISNYLDSYKRAPKEFTLEEVAKYNGKDGTLGYVIINGIVYDTSGIKVWENGNHFGLSAGADLTKQFSNCHSNNSDILKKLKVVGILKQ